jgi:MtrB/PioB family decaheme-associated outer membrane protein
MKPKVLMLVVIFGLFSVPSVAAEEMKIAGEVSLRAEHLSIVGEKAKFNEYRDIRDGFTGDAEFQYERENYYLDFSAREVGRKDQSYDLSGGKWGSFKYDFKYDQLPHNFTYNARTFYSGSGGANLTYQPQPPSTFAPTSNFSNWTTFDYSVERRNYSGGFKLDMLKPFFFGVSAAKEERKGVMPIGTAGTSPGGISIELPAPVNYLTDTIKLEAGYLKNPLSLAFSYVYGQFQNENANLYFRNPATANTAATPDTFTLPPDNNYFKFDFKGGLKLPWNTKFDANASYGRNESSKNLFNSYVSDTSAAASNIGQQGRTGIILSNYVFDGRLDIQNYNFVLTSNPIYFLDGKVFYKYYQTNNKSNQITTTDPGPTPPGVTAATLNNQDRLFDYLTYKYGAQLGFKLPMNLYAIAGYTRGHTSRKRPDIPTYNDDLYEAELRWSGVDWMVIRGGYEQLRRRADFHAPEVTGPSDPNVIENYVRRYDAASKDSYVWKGTVDFFPVEDMTLSVGYKWKDVPYSDTTLGLLSVTGNEWHVDADYLIAKRVKLYGYFDFEYAKMDQKQRTYTSGTTANPALPPTPTDFNWTATETDRNYAYGLGSDIYAIPKKLIFKLQYTFIQSQGSADYTYLLGSNPIPPTRTQDNIDITSLDSYTLRYFLIKATYNPIKSLSLSLGYAYEKYVYDDGQFNGYQYVPLSSTGATLGYLTGAYANQNYRANVYFASASYLF